MKDMPNLSIVILAAGQGKRMQSALPKVLHPIGGKPMLQRVVETASLLKPRNIAIVIGHGGDKVRAAFDTDLAPIQWVEQAQQLGTGHAVLQALPVIGESDTTLILYGDVPLIGHVTLSRLVEAAGKETLVWLTATVDDPVGLGRIVRNQNGDVSAIVEDRDATEQQHGICEINTGFLACPTSWLTHWLPKLGTNNAQGEYYLTDILKLAVEDRKTVITYSPSANWEIAGVNSRAQLVALERIYQRENAHRLLDAGVSLLDAARIDVRGSLQCEPDVTIDVNVIFEGDVWLGRGVKIGANCILKNCRVGAATEIMPFTHIDGAVIGERAKIGPYARLRPTTTLGNEVHIGNFVEVKASRIDEASKANHLSYLGDTIVGKNVNIGAGTITCNYDGANKHQTVIEDDVHIGSDVQLIAPVTVHTGATIGAGTTVWKNVPSQSLTINPKSQAIQTGWLRPIKKTTA
jgi:bifunctional UDP-N-acetylglucosamine pyrophosphorylase/glucosamine-1-phosphate N-acetyltransferase